jgi:hypothetical protein
MVELNTGIDYGLIDYKNEAIIYHLKFGFIGSTNENKLASLYYGFGLDVIPYYKLTNYSSYKNIDYASTRSSAAGLYVDLGGSIYFSKHFSIKAGLEYSSIPATIRLEGKGYFNTLDVKSNFGGMCIHIGAFIGF